MAIIYLLIILVVYITMILVKRTEEKENLLKTLCLGVLVVFAYHILITFIYNLIGIKSSITSLSIAALIIEGFFIFRIIKTKTIQKYYIKKKDIIIAVILLVLVIGIAIKEFGCCFNIKYAITDSAAHYLAAKEFSNESDLLTHVPTDIDKYNFNSFMTAAYVNVGILFKCFSNFLGKFDYYIIYEIFDIFVLFLSGMLFYFLVSQKKKNIKTTILSYIFTILYVIGYQLSVFIAGFQYLGIGLLFILGILIVYKNKEMCRINGKIPIYMYILVGMLNLGLFFSYYFFVPLMYGAIILNELMRNGKKVFKKENIIFLLTTVILPLLIGVFYFVIRPFIMTSYVPATSTDIDGTSAREQFWVFLLFIPFMVYYLYSKLRKKRNDFVAEVLLLLIGFMLLLWIGMELKIVSHYYFCKTYYVLWILALYCTCKVLMKTTHKKGVIMIISWAFVGVYVIMTIINICGIKTTQLWTKYYNNSLILRDPSLLYSREELKILEYIDNNLKDENKVFVKSGTSIWAGALLEEGNPLINAYGFYNDYLKLYDWIWTDQPGIYVNIKRFDKDSKPDYNYYKYTVVYEDEYGFIVKRNE